MNLTLTTEQKEALGLAQRSDDEIDELLIELGQTVFTNALARFIDDLSGPDLAAIETYLDHATDEVQVLRHLHERYPEFATLLEEEQIVAIQALQAA